MRHFRRLYFDNVISEGATEKFVAVIDRGLDSSGIPKVNYQVGNASDIIAVLTRISDTACFFKLPVGASAIVDIYAHDIVGMEEPLSFDYQVFKAKKPVVAPSEPQASTGKAKTKDQDLVDFCESMDMPSTKQTGAGSGPVGPKGPTVATGTTVPTGSTASRICTTNTPCGGATAAECRPDQDPAHCDAVCIQGVLVCRSPSVLPTNVDDTI